MATINLRDLYPEYELDCFVDVLDGDMETYIAAMTKEIADVYVEFQRVENAYQRRKYRYRAHFSLDCGDGIENDAIYHSPSPEELFMDRLTREELSDALDTLPEPQSRRIKAFYLDGISKADIARAEGISEKNVRQSIGRGLSSLQKRIKNYF